MIIIHKALLAEQIAQAIRHLIFSGQLISGSKIPQDQLAEQFGVSRMPIREALAMLNFEGLVMIEPRRGARVARLSLQSIDESYTLREWLESKAVELSVPLLSHEDLVQLRRQYETMEKSGIPQNSDVFVAANYEFHRVLRSRCPWPKLSTIVETLWKGFPPLAPQFVHQQIAHDRQEHYQLLLVAEQHNGSHAAHLMGEHVHRSWEMARNYFRDLGWSDSGSPVPTSDQEASHANN